MKTEKVINTCYAVGAAIVIFGSWKKILHQEGADTFLTIGLLTEVIIFMVSALVEWLPSSKKEMTTHGNVSATTFNDNSQLQNSIDNLNNTIKKVFNQ